MSISFVRPLRVAVFYDGNFFLHVSNYYNYSHPRHSRLSIRGLHKLICKCAGDVEESGSRVMLTGAHYFRGRLSAVEASNRGNQLYNDRIFDDVLMSEGVSTHYMPLRSMSGRHEERGTDVWLALEAYEMAVAGKMDVAVLVVSDTDYVPLARKLQSLGVRVMLLGWNFDYVNEEGVKVVTRTSSDLIQVANYWINMSDMIDKGLREEDENIQMLFVNNSQNADHSDKDYRYSEYDDEVEMSDIFSLKNNFGFIRYPNNNLFFHAQDVVNCSFEDLQEGDTVEFVIGKNSHGQDVAKSVKKVY